MESCRDFISSSSSSLEISNSSIFSSKSSSVVFNFYTNYTHFSSHLENIRDPKIEKLISNLNSRFHGIRDGDDRVDQGKVGILGGQTKVNVLTLRGMSGSRCSPSNNIENRDFSCFNFM